MHDHFCKILIENNVKNKEVKNNNDASFKG